MLYERDHHSAYLESVKASVAVSGRGWGGGVWFEDLKKVLEVVDVTWLEGGRKRERERKREIEGERGRRRKGGWKRGSIYPISDYALIRVTQITHKKLHSKFDLL